MTSLPTLSPSIWFDRQQDERKEDTKRQEVKSEWDTACSCGSLQAVGFLITLIISLLLRLLHFLRQHFRSSSATLSFWPLLPGDE